MRTHQTIDQTEAKAFLRLPRLALVGASDDRRKFANSVYRELRDRPDGTLYPVNPGAATVEGDTCYPTVSALPEGVDGAIVMVPAAHAAEAVAACLDAGVSRIWLFRGVGAGSVSDDALALCEERGADVIAGACPFMFLDHTAGMHRVHRAIRRLRGDVTTTVGAER
jgi:uncharacterized protein